MNNLFKEILNILNIKNPSDIELARIESTLENVDVDKFLTYLLKNFNHYDLKFLNGSQKFIEISKWYFDGVLLSENKEKLSLIDTRAKELAQKVRKTKDPYEKSEYQRAYLGYEHKELNFHNFEGYFRDEDAAILKTVGNLGKCLQLQESISGRDALEDKLSEILKAIVIRGASQTALEDKSANRDVMKLANTTARKF